MKIKRQATKKDSGNPLDLPLAKLEKASNQTVDNTFRSASDCGHLVIDENTKLLEVLAEEFDNNGIVAGRDSRGYKEINGL